MVILGSSRFIDFKDLTRAEIVDGVDFAIISSLFRNKSIHEEIESIYEENKEKAINLYLSSNIYKNGALNYLKYEEIEISTKTTGVFYMLLNSKSDKLLSLCFKTHRDLQTSYKMTNSFNETTIKGLLQKILKMSELKNSDGIDFKVQECILTAIRIAYQYDIPIYALEDLFFKDRETIITFLLGVPNYYYDLVDRHLGREDKHKDILTSDFSDKIKLFKKSWEINNSSKYTYGYLTQVFDCSVKGFRNKSREIKNVIPMIPEGLADNFTLDYLDKEMSNSKFTVNNLIIRANTSLVSHSYDDLDSEYISKKDLDFFIAAVIVESTINKLNWFVACAKILVLAKNQILFKDYLNVKESKTGASALIELKNKNTEMEKLKSENLCLKDKVNKLISTNETLEKDKKELHSKLNNAEKAIKRIEKEKENFTSNKKELIALREMMYNLSQDEVVEIDEITREQMLESLNSLNLVIVGGHPKWVIKMKEHFVNAKWLDPDSQNRSFNHFKDGKYIFIINSATNSHGVTFKLIPIIESNEASELIYLANNFGIDRTIKYLYDKIENK